MSERRLLKLAKVVSAIFSPFYVTCALFAYLVFNNYARLLSYGYVTTVWGYLLLVFIVFCFTIFLPLFTIRIYRRMIGVSTWKFSSRKYRLMPYVLTLTSYVACFMLLNNMSVLSYPTVLMAALFAIVMCVIINIWWKISTHMVGMGGVVGVVLLASGPHGYNPLWPLCGFLLLSGIVGTSRTLLRQHSLGQIVIGFVLGVLSALLFVIVI